jgi:hypothetical protein
MLRQAAVKLFAYENTRRSAMRQDIDEAREFSRLELWHRVSRQGDLEAWAAFQQNLEETVLTWFHGHPGSEAACRLYNEQHFVALAFERLWQLVTKGQVACETLSGVLVFLSASLNGVILETLRDSIRPGAVSSIWPNEEDSTVRNDLWDWLHVRLANQREQRLAYLLYNYGLKPEEIVDCHSKEWSDIHEITRLRRSILARLIHKSEL